MLTISGDGFVSSITQIILGVSSYFNNINANVTYNSIILNTSPDQEQTYELMVYVNGVKANCTINCNFTFTIDSTPEISSISSNNFNDLNTTFTINGSKFSADMSKVKVTIGDEICNVESSSLTSISCILPRLSLGSQNVNIFIDSKLELVLI